MAQVVDDAEERQQPPVGRPSRLRLVEAVEFAEHRAAQETEPAEQQLTLVGRAVGQGDRRGWRGRWRGLSAVGRVGHARDGTWRQRIVVDRWIGAT